ncbi:MAG: ATP-binding protein [Pseudohongiella sp.]|nr:ATP-binding protein [Pseudohongiella sp.]
MINVAVSESRRNRHFGLLVAGLFVSLLIPVELGLRAYRDAAANQAMQETLAQANRLRALLESEINTAAFLATGVESYIVARNGDFEPDEIQRILTLLFGRGRHFRNIGVAPDNRIAWVYPLAGNEAVIGLNYADLPEQWPAIERAMQTGRGQFNGPVELVQGGNGLFYRAPIFLDNVYWGLLSTVIDADSLFSLLDSVSGEFAPLLALRNPGSDIQPDRVFYGQADYFEQPLELLPVIVPGGEWQMAVQMPRDSEPGLAWLRIFATFFVLLLSVLLGLLLRLLWQQNLLGQLDIEVRERTADLSQSNKLLGSVLSAARSFAIIATDLDGTITLFNKGAERMLGYSADEMVGKQQPATFLLTDELRARAASLASELGRPLVGDEVLTLRVRQGVEEILNLHYKHRDGHLVPVQAVISAITGDDGEILGFLGIAEDISDRLRNQTLKDQFVSTVSHELRTPLTAITGALGLVRSGSAGNLPELAQSMVEIAYNNSQRLARLVNDLLDIEKLIAGRMTLYADCHSAADLVHTTIADLQSVAAAHQVRMVETLESNAKLWVDAQRFQQVLTNLLSNAIKFSPAGGQVDVHLSEENGIIQITVSDQGPGIPADFRPHIFQRFSQADAGDNRQRAGTGLGLAISKELTEQMNGSIGFNMNTTQGSCFWLKFTEYKPRDRNKGDRDA